MVATYQGSVLPTVIVDADGTPVLEVSQAGGTRYVRIPSRESLTLFERIGIRLGDLNADLLGIFARMDVGSDLKARPISVSQPKHVFTSRKNSCDWTPKGAATIRTFEVDTYPFQVKLEQCPAQFWNNCLEMLFAPGTGVKDLLSSDRGRALYEEMIKAIYLGLGNSAFMTFNFSQHKSIDAVNTAGGYKVSAGEWADFYDQMTSTQMQGLVTQMDNLADNGEPGFDVPLPDTAFNANGQYTGDIIALLESLKAAAKGDFGEMIYAEPSAGQSMPVFLLSPALFEAYRNYLVLTHAGASEAFRFQLTGTDGQTITLRNVLSYYGMPVVRWSISNSFDSIVGTKSHRAALVAPGALSIAYSGEVPAQYDGMGLQIVQQLDPPYSGKIFMETFLRLGAYVDKEYAVYARNVKLPG